jgi:hypothetical protein
VNNIKVHLSQPIESIKSSLISNAIHDSTTSTNDNMDTTNNNKRKYSLYSNGKIVGNNYDAVVIACPLPLNKCQDKDSMNNKSSSNTLLLDDIVVDISRYIREYRTTHTTFIKGKVRSEYFNKSNDLINVPKTKAELSIEPIMRYVLGEQWDNHNIPDSIYLSEAFQNKVID